MKLRTYVALIFALTIMLLAAILSFAIGKQSSEKVEREIGNTLSATAFQMADKLDFFMWSRSGEMDVISQLEDIRGFKNKESARALLEQLQNSFPAFSWVGLTDADGRVFASTGGILEGIDISQRPVYTEGIKGSFIGDVHEAVLLAELLPNPSGEPVQFVDISKAIEDEEGNIKGVLASHLSWEWSKQVKEEILEPFKDDMKGAEIFIISSMDNTVLLGPAPMVGKPLFLDSIRDAGKKNNHWIIEEWPDGENYLTGYAFGGGYQDYEGLGWKVLVRIPEQIAYAPVKELQHSIFILGVAFSLVFSVLGWYIAGFVTRPLQQITSSAKKLSAGEDVEIPQYKGIQDIEVLSFTLRRLVDSLIRTESDLNKMESIAHHDSLTGLPNRVALEQYLKKSADGSVSAGTALFFLYMDLDGFKQINDRHGHYIGDLVLQETGRKIKSALSPDGHAFRLGGDEFLLVLPASGLTPFEEASSFAENLISMFNHPFYIKDKRLSVGCSIGGAMWGDSAIPPAVIINLADEALFESKRKGKNKVTLKLNTQASAV